MGAINIPIQNLLYGTDENIDKLFLYLYIPVGPKANSIELRLLSSLGHYQARAIPDFVKIVCKNWFFIILTSLNCK